MKYEKSKNAGKNMAFELFNNIYAIIVPFIQRTLMIMYLGMEYAGLGGLFTSILSVLSLAELGVSSAMVYSMYKPIAEDDEGKVLKLLNLYKKYYRIIGSVIFFVGLAITPFLNYLIKDGTCPKDLNIYILFLMTLLSTSLTYWLYAYKNSIIEAYQKNYIRTKNTLKLAVVFDIFQITMIVVFKNYYLYLACAVLRVAATNIFVAYKINKEFPQYQKPNGVLEKQEEKKIKNSVKDIFLNKIGEVLTNSFDSIVISTFLGLTILGQYQNYLYIWTAALTVAGVVFNATRAGIGNSIITETQDKVYEDLKTFTFIVAWIIVILISGFANLFQPFIKIWVGEKNVLGYGVVICLCLFTVLRLYHYLLSTYKSAAGIWHADRYRPLISGILNLMLNLVTVQFWGLYGVILSTVISLILVDVPWLTYNVFRRVFKDISIKKYILYCLKMLLFITVSTICSWIICELIKVGGAMEIIIKILLSMTICNTVMIVLSFKSKEFVRGIDIIKKIIRKG